MENLNNISISSDDSEDDIPFAQRVAQKRSGNSNITVPKKKKEDNLKPMSSAFSETDDSPSTPASKVVRREPVIEVTPPPEPSPYQPRRVPLSKSNSRMSELPDTEEMVPEDSFKSSSSVISRASSSASSRSKKSTKEEKENEKRRREEEKQTKKQQKEFEKKNSKAVKEAEKLVNKQTDKAEVNKYLVVVVDPAAVSCPPGSEVLNLLQNPASGKPEHVFQFQVEQLPVPGSLTWRRKVLSYSVSASGDVQLQEQWQEEARALVFVSTEFLVEKIAARALDSWAEDCKRRLGGHVTLMVYNYEDYFKKETNARQRVKTAGVRGEAASSRDVARVREAVTRYEVEESLVSLSLDSTADHLTFSRSQTKGWRDLAGSVFHQTRAVAEAPEKLKKGMSGSGGFSFWARADSRDCVDSKNLTEYWKQMLMQVSSGAGLEKVSAIVSRYPSPAQLLAAYARCGSEKECAELVAGLEVRRTDNVLGGTRKVGPDIGRRIYTVLTQRSEDTLLTTK